MIVEAFSVASHYMNKTITLAYRVGTDKWHHC